MTKAQLRAYRDIRKERDQLLGMIARLDAILYGPRSGRLDGMPRSGTKDADGQKTAQIEQHDELETLYGGKVEELEKQMRTVETAIASLPPRARTLCRMYYIDGLTWEQVCGEMNYSWSQVHRIHGEALQLIKEKDDAKE